MINAVTRALAVAAALLAVTADAAAQAALAEGFSRLPEGARVLLMPADVELFEISGGGVLEPRADWTADAARHLEEGLRARLGGEVLRPGGEAETAFLRLHEAVSRAVLVHHYGGIVLPGKEGRLDWMLGPQAALAERTGADYALFTHVRDSYASDARKVAIMAGALLAVVMPGGSQQAHASLVELRTGRLVWFNRVSRRSGDLRTPAQARESVEALLEGFPR